MRPLFALIMTVLLLWGTAAYLKFARHNQRPVAELQIDYAQGTFEVEIERTFDCVADPLLEINAIEVTLKGDMVYSQANETPADQPIRFQIKEGVEVGENEINLSLNRANADSFGAVKVTILRNDIPVATKTITSDLDLETVTDSMVFVLGEKQPDDAHDH